MPTSLKKIMQLPEARHLTLLTKNQELNSQIIWTHTIEDAGNMRFVEKDNIIFITGIAIKENQKELLKVIKKLYDKETAGVIVNIGKYITYVSEEIIEFASSVGYPIFTLPWEIKITDINRAICEYIIKHADADRTVEDMIKSIVFNKNELSAAEINHITAYGFDVKANYTVMVVELVMNNVLIDERISNEVYNMIKNILTMSYERHICFFQDNKIIAVLPDRLGASLNGDNIRNKLLAKSYMSDKNIQIEIGFGKRYTGLRNVYKSYEEALKVIFINSKRNNHDSYFYDELGFYKLVFDIKDSREMTAIYEETIGKLAEYDQMHHTDYVEVMRIYLLENKSITEVSKKLYIHRNTVTYKLKKIEEMLHIDLNELDDTIKIKLAILVRELL